MNGEEYEYIIEDGISEVQIFTFELEKAIQKYVNKQKVDYPTKQLITEVLLNRLNRKMLEKIKLDIK